MKKIIIIAHNLRSCHNVGSILRTAEGFAIEKVYFTGYTPYPQKSSNDTRLPHLARKIHAAIHKTALDAEDQVVWEQVDDVSAIIAQLKSQGYTIAAVEQAPTSVPLNSYKAPEKIALIMGREVEGVEPEVLEVCDVILEIPMYGRKESFNVSIAAALAMYACRFGA